MRIAQVAPLWERVPPRLYGGTERVVHGLTEELVRRGHDVTLFASGDSSTSAKLVPICDEALRLDSSVTDPYVYITLQLGAVIAAGEQFDVVHSHIDYFIYPLARVMETPVLSTLHGRLDLPELQHLYKKWSDVSLVSISNAQRRPLLSLNLNWRATVYHGIALENFTPRTEPGDYLAFLGRISPEKGPERAIEVAKRMGMPLKIAAKVDKVDQEYFEEVIAPLLDHPLIEFIGEIDETAKNDFLGNAYALIFPICWPEPFGLTMVESMACGTPVIATRWGSVPEIMEDGANGFICEDESIDAIVAACRRVPEIDRLGCRECAERRFSWERAAEDYEAVYEALIEEKLMRGRRFFVVPVPERATSWLPSDALAVDQLQTAGGLMDGELESAQT